MKSPESIPEGARWYATDLTDNSITPIPESPRVRWQFDDAWVEAPTEQEERQNLIEANRAFHDMIDTPRWLIPNRDQTYREMTQTEVRERVLIENP